MPLPGLTYSRPSESHFSEGTLALPPFIGDPVSCPPVPPFGSVIVSHSSTLPVSSAHTTLTFSSGAAATPLSAPPLQECQGPPILWCRHHSHISTTPLQGHRYPHLITAIFGYYHRPPVAATFHRLPGHSSLTSLCLHYSAIPFRCSSVDAPKTVHKEIHWRPDKMGNILGLFRLIDPFEPILVKCR